MPGKHTIGIDLGGTNIKAGILDSDGALIYRCSIETQAERGFEHVFCRLVQLVDNCICAANLTKADIAAIGYGTPGPMSHEEGIVYASPNLPGWKDIPLRARFTEATGLPVVLDNDANVAAYGEFVAGAGKGTRDMVLLTLGTGIGGGIVLNGELQRGAFDNAAEIGHIIAVPNGRPCPCGQRGCLERYGSANAVAERFVEALETGDDSPLKERVAAGEGGPGRRRARRPDLGRNLPLSGAGMCEHSTHAQSRVRRFRRRVDRGRRAVAGPDPAALRATGLERREGLPADRTRHTRR